MLQVEHDGRQWELVQTKIEDGWRHDIYVDGKLKYGGFNHKRFTTKSFEKYISDFVVEDVVQEDTTEIDRILEMNRQLNRERNGERGEWGAYLFIGSLTLFVILLILLS